MPNLRHFSPAYLAVLNFAGLEMTHLGHLASLLELEMVIFGIFDFSRVSIVSLRGVVFFQFALACYFEKNLLSPLELLPNALDHLNKELMLMTHHRYE